MSSQIKTTLTAYHFSFKPTGDDDVDRILEAVASAGKAYHNTSDWGEKNEWNDNKSCADVIQERAQALADKINGTK